jgi:hypothetical protein
VSAEELARAFKDNESAADGKFKDQWLQVEGKVLDVVPGPTEPGSTVDVVRIKLAGTKLPKNNFDFAVSCDVRKEESSGAWDLARGQTVKLKGKCIGGNTLQTYVRLQHCRIDGKGPDPAVRTTATAMLGEYTRNRETANDKYKDKEVLITSARFVSMTPGNDLVVFSGISKAGKEIKIQANFTFGQRKKLEALQANRPVKFRAECGGIFQDTVACYRAYLVP